MTRKRQHPPMGSAGASHDHQGNGITPKTNDLTLPGLGTPADIPVWVLDLVLDGNVVACMASIGLMAVPDTLMVEGMANGHDVDNATLTMLRNVDGRTVSIFRMPRNVGGAR